jgi:hypothetical protein
MASNGQEMDEHYSEHKSDTCITQHVDKHAWNGPSFG